MVRVRASDSGSEPPTGQLYPSPRFPDRESPISTHRLSRTNKDLMILNFSSPTDKNFIIWLIQVMYIILYIALVQDPTNLNGRRAQSLPYVDLLAWLPTRSCKFGHGRLNQLYSAPPGPSSICLPSTPPAAPFRSSLVSRSCDPPRGALSLRPFVAQLGSPPSPLPRSNADRVANRLA